MPRNIHQISKYRYMMSGETDIGIGHDEVFLKEGKKKLKNFNKILGGYQ